MGIFEKSLPSRQYSMTILIGIWNFSDNLGKSWNLVTYWKLLAKFGDYLRKFWRLMTSWKLLAKFSGYLGNYNYYKDYLRKSFTKSSITNQLSNKGAFHFTTTTVWTIVTSLWVISFQQIWQPNVSLLTTKLIICSTMSSWPSTCNCYPWTCTLDEVIILFKIR